METSDVTYCFEIDNCVFRALRDSMEFIVMHVDFQVNILEVE